MPGPILAVPDASKAVWKMCEYCGCGDVEAIAELIREHETIIDLVSDVHYALRDDDAPRTVKALREIASVLGPHVRVEEEGLFPAIARDFPEHVAVLSLEHERIETEITRLAASLENGIARDEELTEILTLLKRHIMKEQDGVFPAAVTTLTAQDWNRLDAVRARVG